MLTRYLLELTLIDNKFVKYLPSKMAAASVYLANKVF